jgi:pyrimidine-nucleoside phosphorylase
MRPQDIIAKKRDGGELTAGEIADFIRGVCDASWADYQISALVMAMFIRGLSDAEGETLVREMLQSGEVLDFSDIDRPKADKHSTGGVGDKCSLVIAPLAAACGVAVPMISGRGLGHTGGTLDKLESIPGFKVNLTSEEFHRVIRECGYAMAGQTADIAPADKKIYALRDATATVPYLPLIVASIMSKKLAEGLDALVLDVKTGSGAFMQGREDAVALAKAMVECGGKFGVRTEAVVTDMGQPLGKYVGNALEVYECIKILRNEVEPAVEPTRDISIELTARMLVLTGIAKDLEEAKRSCAEKLESGEAIELFRRNVELQGGDSSVCDHPESLVSGEISRFEVVTESAGYITDVDTMAVGDAMCVLGGGRNRAEDSIDHAVGFASDVKIGDRVDQGQALATVFCRTPDQFGAVRAKLSGAYAISSDQPASTQLILDVIGG